MRFTAWLSDGFLPGVVAMVLWSLMLIGHFIALARLDDPRTPTRVYRLQSCRRDSRSRTRFWRRHMLARFSKAMLYSPDTNRG